MKKAELSCLQHMAPSPFTYTPSPESPDSNGRSTPDLYLRSSLHISCPPKWLRRSICYSLRKSVPHKDSHTGSLVPSVLVKLRRGETFKEVTRKDEMGLLDRFIIEWGLSPHCSGLLSYHGLALSCIFMLPAKMSHS